MSDTPKIKCPYCQWWFASPNDLHQHMMAKRRVSAAHGMEGNRPRPRSVVQEQYEAAWRVKESLR